MYACCLWRSVRLQHIFERKEQQLGILDSARDDREQEGDEYELTQRGDRGAADKNAKAQDRKKREQRAKKLQPSLKWQSLGTTDGDRTE